MTGEYEIEIMPHNRRDKMCISKFTKLSIYT